MKWFALWLYVWGALVVGLAIREARPEVSRDKLWAVSVLWPVLVPVGMVQSHVVSVNVSVEPRP